MIAAATATTSTPRTRRTHPCGADAEKAHRISSGNGNLRTLKAFLGFLDSEVFQGGLKLATTAQPAIAPLSQIVVGLTKSIAKRNRNVGVQEFSMGLDFTRNVTGARLAEGDYIAVQIPQKLQVIWDWDEWLYNPRNGQIVRTNDSLALIPYNYLVFSISRYDGP